MWLFPVRPKQPTLVRTVPVRVTDAERWRPLKSWLLSDWAGIQGTSKWHTGTEGGRAPTSAHLSFICLISSDALPSRKRGTLGSHSISLPGPLTILRYWRRVILKDLLSETQLYLEGGGRQPRRPAREVPRRCIVSWNHTAVDPSVGTV